MPEVVREHDRLDGKTVHAQGWVKRCSSINCDLAENQLFGGKSLTIGWSNDFDNSVATFVQPAEVVLEAKVQAACFDHRSEQTVQIRPKALCVDRVGQLVEPKLLRVIAH